MPQMHEVDYKIYGDDMFVEVESIRARRRCRKPAPWGCWPAPASGS